MVKVPAAAEAVVEELADLGEPEPAAEDVDLGLEALADPVEPAPTVKPVKATPAKKAPAKAAAKPAEPVAAVAPADDSAEAKKARVAAIREWGNATYGAGTVGDRGRLNGDLVAAYDAQDSSLYTPGAKKTPAKSTATGKRRGRPPGSGNKAAVEAARVASAPASAPAKLSVSPAVHHVISMNGQLVVVQVVGVVTPV